MIKNKTAFIFDMDGVICHNIPYHKQAWAKFMRAHDFVYSDKFFDAHINGQTNEEILKQLFGKKITDAKTKKYINKKERFYRKIYTPYIKPLPGLITFLEELTKNKIKTLMTKLPRNDPLIFPFGTFLLFFLITL